MSNVRIFPMRDRDYIETKMDKTIESGATLEQLALLGVVLHVVEMEFDAAIMAVAVVLDKESKEFPYLIVSQSSSLQSNGRYFTQCRCHKDSITNPFDKVQIEKMVECNMSDHWSIGLGVDWCAL